MKLKYCNVSSAKRRVISKCIGTIFLPFLKHLKRYLYKRDNFIFHTFHGCISTGTFKPKSKFYLIVKFHIANGAKRKPPSESTVQQLSFSESLLLRFSPQNYITWLTEDFTEIDFLRCRRRQTRVGKLQNIGFFFSRESSSNFNILLNLTWQQIALFLSALQTSFTFGKHSHVKYAFANTKKLLNNSWE